MAALTLADWLAELRPGETPVFRHTKAALADLDARRDQLSAREIAAPILADPLATLRLVYTANNRSSRHFSQEVACVEHAIMMQGVGAFLDKARGLPVFEDSALGKDRETLDSLYRLLRMTQHAAWQARDFAVLHADLRAEEIQVAAILHYAPEFLFWLDAPDTARQLARLRRRLPTEAAEQETLGFPLAPLRLMLLEAWKIPEVTRFLLDTPAANQPRQTILHASLAIANHSRHGWWNCQLEPAYQALADTVHMRPDEVVGTVHANAIRVARFGNWIPAAPAAAWLVMEAGEWPVEADAAEMPVPEDAQAAAPAPSTVEQARKAPEEPSPRSVLEETMASIEAHLDGSFNLNQMLAVILRGLHHGLGLTRILFALATPDGKRVKCRFTLGVPADDPLRHFEVTLGERDLFAQLMTRMQGVWLNEGNRAKLWPLVGTRLQGLIGEGDFYAMSIFGGSRPLGLIYADRGQANGSLDPGTYTDFKMLCLQAARGLSKVKA